MVASARRARLALLGIHAVCLSTLATEGIARMATDPTPFADLPAALVEDVLNQTTAVGDLLFETFRRIKTDRAGYREQLLEKGFIRNESSLGYPPLPTTCGTDGSYAIERLLSADLTAAAAVAVEGLTP